MDEGIWGPLLDSPARKQPTQGSADRNRLTANRNIEKQQHKNLNFKNKEDRWSKKHLNIKGEILKKGYPNEDIPTRIPAN